MSPQAAIQCISIFIVDDNNFDEDIEIIYLNLTNKDYFINKVDYLAEVEVTDNDSKRTGRKKGVRALLELDVFRKGTQSG